MTATQDNSQKPFLTPSPNVNNSPISKSKPYYLGHRKRIKDKFLSSISESFTDYELIEMLLFLLNPRGDVKTVAKKIIDRFGNIKSFVKADKNIIQTKLKDIASNVNLVFLSKLLQEVILRTLTCEFKEKTVFNKWESLIQYLQMKFGSLTYEQFSVLYLDVLNQLIEIVQFGSGTIDESSVYPREIIKKGLDLGAVKMVLVHNHYSNNPNPSPNDITLTKNIIEAGKVVSIDVVDHVIICADQWFSFRENSLL